MMAPEVYSEHLLMPKIFIFFIYLELCTFLIYSCIVSSTFSHFRTVVTKIFFVLFSIKRVSNKDILFAPAPGLK